MCRINTNIWAPFCTTLNLFNLYSKYAKANIYPYFVNKY